MKSPILVTGALGFIGSNLCLKLLEVGYLIIGIDNITNNYNPIFKEKNLSELQKKKKFYFYQEDIRNQDAIRTIFKRHLPIKVIHLAAMPGVRASLLQPELFHDVNVYGTQTVYQIAADFHVKQFIFSSSSSVYGNSASVPFSENARLIPLSPYAQTKYLAEKLLQKLHKKYVVPTYIVRLFSVYGPRGRPDMAPYLFTEAACKGLPIIQYGDGTSARDYTHVGDVIRAIILALKTPLTWGIFNIGNSSPVRLMDLIDSIQTYTSKRINLKFKKSLPIEPVVTYANIKEAEKYLNWKPSIPFSKGMRQFIDWYKNNRIQLV